MSKLTRLLVIPILIMLSVTAGLRLARGQAVLIWNDTSFNGGVFVTPVPNTPFSGVVVQKITQVLGDGSSFERRTMAFIARDSRGRIHNEFRTIVPAAWTGDAPLRSIHLYDPETRMDLVLNPGTHIAQQRILNFPPATAPPANWAQRETANRRLAPNVREADLGTDVIEGFEAHGYRRTTTLSGESTGIGHAIDVVDEYWYSEELHIDMVMKHSDPRTGTLTSAVTKVNINEPAVELFEVAPQFKVVDLTPSN